MSILMSYSPDIQTFQAIQMRFVGAIYIQTHPHPI